MIIDVLSSFATSTVGAAAGSGIALWGAFAVYKRQYRDSLTQKYIDEFYSTSFLVHRIEAAKVRRWILEDDPKLKGTNRSRIHALASGFWHPGYQDYFQGEERDGLSQHQHIEAILMYVSKVIASIERKAVDETKLRDAIGDSYFWLDNLLFPLEIEVLRQVKEYEATGQKAKAYNRIKKLGFLANAMGVIERTGPISKPVCGALPTEEIDGTEG